MSICIAAFAERGKYIVLASDSMASLFGGAFSADQTLVKAGNLVERRWAAYYAGDDIGRVESVLARAREQFANDTPPSLQTVREALLDAYRCERMQLAVETHLGIYGMDMQVFLAKGLKTFGPTGFGIIRERLEHVSLDFGLLIAGFDESDTATIFEIDHPGVYRDRRPLGFWAIGSGSLAAIGRLSARHQAKWLSVAQTVYNVCEAKIAAEGAFGVGPTMGLLVVAADESARTLISPAKEELRSACLANLNPTVSPALLSMIEKSLLTRADQSSRAINSSTDQT